MDHKAKQIFQYLLSIQNITSPPIRNFQQYGVYKYLSDLPQTNGCILYGSEAYPEAWLEIHKPTLPSAPLPPSSLVEWLQSDYKDERNEPTFYNEQSLPSKENPHSLRTVLFTEDSTRIDQQTHWLQTWREWAEECKRRKQLKLLYGTLFALRQQLEREGETIEIAFGHGMLSWEHPKGKIYHPLFITRMEISFNARKGLFTLTPTSKGTQLEMEMLAGLELPNETLFGQLQQRVIEEKVNPLDPESIFPLYHEIAHTIDPEGRFDPKCSPSFSQKPLITNQTIWFVRKKNNKQWKDELNTVLKEIEEGRELPLPLKALTQLPDDNAAQVHTPDWKEVGEDLFFPLPANEEQREIARRLARQFGVTVQGPPGTGKSHTIVNLISHLLAHGKKVLVTSQKEPALRVLADKIPKDIRSLCVSVLGGDSKSLQEIEDSVRSISNKMAEYDSETLRKESEQLQVALKQAMKEEAEAQNQLRQAAHREQLKMKWYEEELLPSAVAEKLTATENQHGWLPDDLNSSPPLSDGQMRRLWQLTGALSVDLPHIATQFIIPDVEKLDSPTHFSIWAEKGIKYKKQLTQYQHLLTKYPLPQASTPLQEIEQHLNTILRHKELLAHTHVQLMLQDLLAGGTRAQSWEQLYEFTCTQLADIADIHQQLAEFDIQLPAVDRVKLEQDLQSLEEQFRKTGKASALYLLTSGRKVRYLVKHPLLNGRPLQTEQDVEQIRKRIQGQEKRERLIRKWNTLFQEIDGPLLDPARKRITAEVDPFLKELKDVLQLAQLIKQLHHMVPAPFPASLKWEEVAVYEDLLQAVQVTYTKLAWNTWRSEHQQKQEQLEKNLLQAHHPLCSHLLTALNKLDENKWREAFEQSHSLQTAVAEYEEWKTLLDRLATVAPRWASQIEQQLGNHEPFPVDWQEAWHWRRAETTIRHINQFQPEKIEAQIHSSQRKQRKLTEQIVAKSAWRKQLERITETQKRSLMAWKQQIKRIGKGTGKYAAKHRQDARREMEHCQSAIPVWIMPIHRVIENLALDNELFDVVIVDESSQCDIFSLTALLRAKKAVVVGDDEQISPAAVGINQEQVRTLISRHLEGIPQANSLDMQTSLYDIATRIFPEKLMLKEHFRCAPEIIQFSNEVSYGNEVIPLRHPTAAERIDPPVLAKRVVGYREEGRVLNLPEAEAIVEDIRKLVNDPFFTDHSMGVISLLGSEQADLIDSKLRHVIGEEEMVKRRLICGDAYAFQGDERDIMFLSLVVAGNVRYQALTRRDAQQRFNVAASRAQNQMRLYHSVDLEDLNPEDLRYRLLSYCQHPVRPLEPVKDLQHDCESQLEMDVLRMIIARGFQVRPHVKIGKFCIDLVIEGVKHRLAVECDGDAWHTIENWEEDIARQRILERSGWTFWRVRGSAFYRNPEETMSSLWTKLDEMGIKPGIVKPS
ncbi:AAA domain-containing protein [Mechercharimyces sp. CAU 1602]|uniref:AAA domain-containing protein n=1 Tax=Mechercharimyces sp. CAU 1602 TaxID=2973933 RepID=UPI0021620559|nr:AAA domain-containing protein [Mechercharimyces sp. CAU 1602]MCS1352728.1 AAA domain-containing protein [Mechercharimyces sp. CAU 1602]